MFDWKWSRGENKEVGFHSKALEYFTIQTDLTKTLPFVRDTREMMKSQQRSLSHYSLNYFLGLSGRTRLCCFRQLSIPRLVHRGSSSSVRGARCSLGGIVLFFWELMNEAAHLFDRCLLDDYKSPFFNSLK